MYDLDKEISIQIEILDNGTGFESINHDMIYEPFFTIKNHASGFSLTLSELVLIIHNRNSIRKSLILWI